MVNLRIEPLLAARVRGEVDIPETGCHARIANGSDRGTLTQNLQGPDGGSQETGSAVLVRHGRGPARSTSGALKLLEAVL